MCDVREFERSFGGFTRKKRSSQENGSCLACTLAPQTGVWVQLWVDKPEGSEPRVKEVRRGGAASITWELVRDAHPQAPHQTYQTLEWGPVICFNTHPACTLDWRIRILCPARLPFLPPPPLLYPTAPMLPQQGRAATGERRANSQRSLWPQGH